MRWLRSLPNLLAGVTSGLVTLVYSISFAALIFSGKLSVYFPQGVGIALVGAALTAILVAWRSPFPFTIAGPEANSAIIIALAASSIATALDSAHREAAIFPTVWAAIALSTALTGLLLYVLGRFHLGRLARYIPYPVIGGFLAGTGWLIARNSFKVMTGIPLGIAAVGPLLQGHVVAQWVCGLGMAVILFVLLHRWGHFLALPGLLLGGIAVGNIGWWALERFSIHATAQDWFFSPFSRASVWQGWTLSTLSGIDWAVLFQQGGTLLAMMVIVLLSILLNSTGLELTTSRNVDLDQELKADGVANLVTGFCGGMVGYLSVNRCLLNQQAGAQSPLAGMIAGGFCGAVLLLGSAFLAYIPKAILGGLLLYIGANLLFRWVYKAWSQVPRAEYVLIVLILVVIATAGFLQGVAAGILISCFLFILSYGKTSCIKYTLSGTNYHSNVFRSLPQQRLLHEEGDKIAILVLHGFVFFGTANDLLEGIRRRLGPTGQRNLVYAVFDFRLVAGLDYSAALTFMKLRQLAGKSGLSLVFTHLGPAIQTQLTQAGVLASDQPDVRCFNDLDRGVEWCEDQILAANQLLTSPASGLDSQLEGLLNDSDLAHGMKQYLLPMDVSAGEVLLHEGQAPDGLYFLESGRASVLVELPNGRTLRRRTYTGGAILGEMGFYSEAPRSASVVADEPCRVHYLSIQAFQKIESDVPHLASCFNRGVVKLVAERLRRSEEEVRSLLQ